MVDEEAAGATDSRGCLLQGTTTLNQLGTASFRVGAMLAAALTETTLGRTLGVVAVALAAVNVFGGFLVTRRMLEMFKKKERPAAKSGEKA